MQGVGFSVGDIGHVREIPSEYGTVLLSETLNLINPTHSISDPNPTAPCEELHKLLLTGRDGLLPRYASHTEAI